MIVIVEPESAGAISGGEVAGAVVGQLPAQVPPLWARSPRRVHSR
jgi:hypothetical protein